MNPVALVALSAKALVSKHYFGTDSEVLERGNNGEFRNK